MEEHFNPHTYKVIDSVTGEEIPVQVFIEKANKEYWEKAYAKTLAEYIGVTGSANCKVLAYIIKEKNIDNILLCTVRGMASNLDISATCVQTMMKLLQEKKHIKKICNGQYLVNPNLLRHGSRNRGAMLIRLWGDT